MGSVLLCLSTSVSHLLCGWMWKKTCSGSCRRLNYWIVKIALVDLKVCLFHERWEQISWFLNVSAQFALNGNFCGNFEHAADLEFLDRGLPKSFFVPFTLVPGASCKWLESCCHFWSFAESGSDSMNFLAFLKICKIFFLNIFNNLAFILNLHPRSRVLHV